MAVTRYYDCEPLTDDFAKYCNERSYTIADVQTDPDLRKRLEREYLRAQEGKTS